MFVPVREPGSWRRVQNDIVTPKVADVEPGNSLGIIVGSLGRASISPGKQGLRWSMLFRLIQITSDWDRFIRTFENRTVNDTARDKQPASPGGQLEEPSRTGVEKRPG
jgi:hypothetical protein